MAPTAANPTAAAPTVATKAVRPNPPLLGATAAAVPETSKMFYERKPFSLNKALHREKHLKLE